MKFIKKVVKNEDQLTPKTLTQHNFKVEQRSSTAIKNRPNDNFTMKYEDSINPLMQTPKTYKESNSKEAKINCVQEAFNLIKDQLEEEEIKGKYLFKIIIMN